MPAAKAPKPVAGKAGGGLAEQRSAKPIGKVIHFFDKISVAVVKLDTGLKLGDKIRIEGHGQGFEQAVDSMQIEHEQLKEAKKGQEVGMKVAKPVKAGDLVYKA
jgi:translation elongation factor EF-1alpha